MPVKRNKGMTPTRSRAAIPHTKKATGTASKVIRKVRTRLDRRQSNWQEVPSTKYAKGFHKPGSENRNKH